MEIHNHFEWYDILQYHTDEISNLPAANVLDEILDEVFKRESSKSWVGLNQDICLPIVHTGSKVYIYTLDEK